MLTQRHPTPNPNPNSNPNLNPNLNPTPNPTQPTSTNFVAVKQALEDNYDCLSVTCASVGGLWDTAAGTYFPGASPCGGVAICLAGQNGTEADGDAATRVGAGEVSAERNSGEKNLVEKVSVLLAVVVTALVSLLLWVAAAG